MPRTEEEKRAAIQESINSGQAVNILSLTFGRTNTTLKSIARYLDMNVGANTATESLKTAVFRQSGKDPLRTYSQDYTEVINLLIEHGADVSQLEVGTWGFPQYPRDKMGYKTYRTVITALMRRDLQEGRISSKRADAVKSAIYDGPPVI
jgi:hypothetical protein